MSFATIEDLRSQLEGSPVQTPEYTAKMMHAIPPTTEVDRNKFIVDRCRGKRVLEFGASGNLHEKIVGVAKELIGVDLDAGENVVVFDLDDVTQPDLPANVGFAEIIVCGEIIEHLSNPGWFLKRLKRQYSGIPVIISAPNAFSRIARLHLQNAVENVNKDHVCWYSWKTLSTLVERAGFTVREFYCYNGKAPTSEGLVMVVD